MDWTETRYKFLRWLRTISKTPEAAIAPKWVYFFYYLLFPSHWARDYDSRISYDIKTDIYTIQGMKFSGEVFYHFKRSKGLQFEIVESGDVDGVVTIKEIKKYPSMGLDLYE